LQSRLASAIARAQTTNNTKENCPSGWHEVAESRCCPMDEPQLIGGKCYPVCDDGQDDFVLGSFVGCRDQCPGGYASSLNTCTRGANQHTRADSPRDGVLPQLQQFPEKETDTTCPTDYVKVSRLPRGKHGKKIRTHRGGGCCPTSAPLLMGRGCYADCPADQDPITVGDFVGCRAHCPDGWTEDNNECSKDNEESVERSDFPREPSLPANRLRSIQSQSEIDGCAHGYVAASPTSSYCCPFNKPQLKGLLCYETCARGWEESGYGCRRKCKKGWSSTLMTCNRNGRVTWRKGYERHPSPSKSRTTPPTTTTTTTTTDDGPTPVVD